MRVLRLRFHAEEAALRLRRFHILACPEAAELERQILAIRETGKKARRKRAALRDKMERAIANFDYTQDIRCLS
jgi:hypothetical protein